jgi:hypothetical protein
MKASIRFIRCAAVLPFLWAGGCGSDKDSPAAPADPTASPSLTLPADVQVLRNSLDAYASFALAKAAGYSAAITDCMSNGDEGAMGIHYGNPSYIDGTVDAAHPEVLIYEPGTDGQMSLVGVEFIVPFTAVPKSAPAPSLFGQKFSPNDVFGVWGLHVWTHRLNPSGTFAMWNPRVHC